VYQFSVNWIWNQSWRQPIRRRRSMNLRADL
jgi:hypothetical protein